MSINKSPLSNCSTTANEILNNFRLQRNNSRINIGDSQKTTSVLQKRIPKNGEHLSGNVNAVENQTKIPERIKTPMEKMSGFDLSGVKVHYNSPRPAKLNAVAYTQGEDIYVGPGQEKHLPHESWHAVQQMQGRVRSTTQANGVPINDDKKLETEADEMGNKALNTGLTTSQMNNTNPIKKRGHSSKNNRYLKQKKSTQEFKIGNTQYKTESLKAEQGISQLQSNQQTSSTEGDDPQVRQDYEALQPDQGAGNESQSAPQPSRSSGPRSNDDGASQLKIMDVAQLAGCSPRNTALGNNALDYVRRTKANWRSHVTYDYRIRNSYNSLRINAYVFAKVYYGLWVSWEHIRFNATVDLTCQKVASNCEIAVNERGGSVFDYTNSPASGAIAIQTSSRAAGTQMAMTIRVGGAVGASSGVSAGVGSASAGVSFPDASISHKTSMGTFIYTCSESH